jgi:hypothetical protein
MWSCVDTNLYDLLRKINYIHTEKMGGEWDASKAVHQLARIRVFNKRGNVRVT